MSNNFDSFSMELERSISVQNHEVNCREQIGISRNFILCNCMHLSNRSEVVEFRQNRQVFDLNFDGQTFEISHCFFSLARMLLNVESE